MNPNTRFAIAATIVLVILNAAWITMGVNW